MYPVSDDYISAIQSTDRTKAIKVHIDTAFESYDFTDEDIQEGTLKIEEAAISGSTFGPGGVYAANLTLTLLNTDGRFDDTQFNGGRVMVYDGTQLANGEYEWVPLGIFNIDDVSRPTTTVTIQATDNMLLLDRPFKNVNISFPATCLQIVAQICSYCGVTLATANFYNHDYVIKERPDNDDMSCRDALSNICEIAGSFARCSRQSGAIEIVRFINPGCVIECNISGGNFTDYSSGDDISGGDFNWWNNRYRSGGVFKEPEPCVELGPDNRYNFTIDDSPITITGITFEADNKTYLIGSDYYAIKLSDNPFIQGDPTEILNLIFDCFYKFTFLPFTSDWQGNPALQPGDVIRQTDKKGNSYLTIVTNSTYAYRGSCQISAKGASQISNGYQSQSSKQFAQLQRKIYQKQQQINVLTDALSNASKMLAGMWGGHVVVGDNLPDEKYHGNIFICDNVGDDPTNPDVTKAVKVWRWNLGGFGYSENGIDGPYLSAFTADGNIVANIITASMIRTGVLQSLNGASWIDLDDGSFSFGDGALIFSKNASKLTSKSGTTWIDLLNDTFSFNSGALLYDKNGIKATHSDGSYTTLSGSGLLHHNGSTKNEYHYLMYTGKVFQQFTSQPVDYNKNHQTYGTFTVSLPAEFKNKKVAISVSLNEYDFPGDIFGSVNGIRIGTPSYDPSTGNFSASIFIKAYSPYSTEGDTYMLWSGISYTAIA